MAVSKRAKAIYTNFFDGIETFAANRISNLQENCYLRRNIAKDVSLFKKQQQEMKKIRAPYIKISNDWTLYYSAKNRNFHQFNNGPLFGNLNERVLNEVFGVK